MYKLTERAADDFAGIYDYTLLKFGEAQADHYTDALEAFFETLAGMPDMGRDYHTVPGVMRIEFQRHAIFYFTMTPAPNFAGLRRCSIQQVYQ